MVILSWLCWILSSWLLELIRDTCVVGRNLRGFILNSISYSDGRLLSSGVVMYIHSAVSGYCSAACAFFHSYLTVPTALSATLLAWWWCNTLNVSLMLDSLYRFVSFSDVYCVPKLATISCGIPNSNINYVNLSATALAVMLLSLVMIGYEMRNFPLIVKNVSS